MSKQIDIAKPIEFKSAGLRKAGWKAVVATDKGASWWPLLGYVVNAEGEAFAVQWSETGSAGLSIDSDLDYQIDWTIRNVPEKKIKVDVWLNVYRNDSGEAYPLVFTTKDRADSYAEGRLACLHIVQEVEEGFGVTKDDDIRKGAPLPR